MADATNILKGAPAQVAIYDGSNGTLYFGYLSADDIEMGEKSLIHKIIDGTRKQYGTRTSFRCNLLESDPAKIAALATRRAAKQTVYITGFNFGMKLSNCYVNYSQSRDFEPGGECLIQAEFYTEVEADVEVIRNLLGSQGGFQTDGGGGLGTGWVDVGLTSTSQNDPSFLNGAGNNDQQINASGINQYIYNRTTWIFDQPLTLTASVYAQSVTTSEDFQIEVRAQDSAHGLLSAYYGDTETATTGGTDRFFTTVRIIDEDVFEIEVRLIKKTNSGNVKFDDCQVEFGPLAPYTENT